MKVEFTFLGNSTAYCVLTLCSYGETGDYEAFPTVPLSIQPREFAESLKISGYDAIRYDSSRISFKNKSVEITVFESGRMLFEQVSPNSQSAVGDLLKMLLSNYSSLQLSINMNHHDASGDAAT